MKNKNFKKKIILITGANGNIGRYLARSLFYQGAKIILTDKETKSKNNFGDYFSCNFEDSSQINNLIIKIKKKYKLIDSIINNAAMVGDNFSKEKKNNFKFLSNEWQRCLNVNLIAIYHICLGFENSLKNSKSPSIINISSIYSLVGPDKNLYQGTLLFNPASYAASKGGLNSLTRWLAGSLNNKIRTNSISLGGIFRKQDKKFVKKYVNKTIQKRMAKEEDVIGPVLFLISDDSKYITGQNLVVDGGYSII